MKRTCSFVINRRQRRSLYITMIRSQFEHCSSVWFPSSKVTLDKLEAIQKKSINWIIGDDYCSSKDEHKYFLKCKELDLLPIKLRLVLKDLKLLHNIINCRSVIELPSYIHFHEGQNRLRSSHLDSLSLVSDITPKISNNLSKSGDSVSTSFSQFSNSFFYRAINSWNGLTYETRCLSSSSKFETATLKHLWELALPIPLTTFVLFA